MIRTLKKEIYSRILSDKNLSLDLANILDIKQNSVEWLARRESSKLLNINVIQIFLNHGLTETEIFSVIGENSESNHQSI